MNHPSRFATAVRVCIGLALGMPLACAGSVAIPQSPSQSSSQPSGAGQSPAALQKHVTLILHPRNRAGLERLIEAQNTPGDPRWHQWLDPAQFRARYSPSPDVVQKLVTWLSSNGFGNIRVSADRLLLSASAPATVADTILPALVSGGQASSSANLPSAVTQTAIPGLQGVVSGILGLASPLKMRTFSRVYPSADRVVESPPTARTFASGMAQRLDPPQFRVAYDVPPLPVGTTVPPVAIFMAGDLEPVKTDLQQAEAQFQMPQVPVRVVPVPSTSTSTSNSDVCADVGVSETTEWDLDSQAVLGMAGPLQGMVWYDMTSLCSGDVVKAVSMWVNDPDAPRVASMSFGLHEDQAQSSGAMHAMDELLQEAAAMGRSVFVAAGDMESGCAGGLLSGIANPPYCGLYYPASSPWAVAVGGTTLYTDSRGGWMEEDAWPGTVGGASAYEAQMPWQSGVVDPDVCAGNRCVPDMAMDAHPGANIIVNGNPQPSGSAIGGASLSAPLAMAAWARLQVVAGRDGFAPRDLYALSVARGQPASGFHDIVGGGNGIYTAMPGWDPVTGLGSFDVARIQAALVNLPANTTPLPAGGSSSSGGGGFDLVALLLLGLLAVVRRFS